ncbi:tubulin polyglutamylase TTLL11-like [Branchiostoma floridae]|uniref:Tubulin polyglutamylase TTLL11-like n=1 Tax=Branchiostoma floridae TaxID=7739 RepID=A0A9J7LN06_BRAFL|nr:tubulin polyglutamylase TTLL11-like [Branchiostoma floridae]
MSVKLQNMSDRLSAVQIHGHAIAVPDGPQHPSLPRPRARSKSPAVHGRRVALTPISIPPRTRTPSPRARTHRTPSPRPLSATGSRPASAGQVDGGDLLGRAATLYPTSMFSFETFRRRDSGDTFRRIVVEESSRSSKEKRPKSSMSTADSEKTESGSDADVDAEGRKRKGKQGIVRRRRLPTALVVTLDTTRARSQLDVIRLALKQLGRGWREYPHGRKAGSDMYWSVPAFNDYDDFPSGIINKLPGMKDMSNKANLSQALDRMHQLFPEAFDFFPTTWRLPEEFHQFCAEVRILKERRGKRYKPTFIVKPDEGTQGGGIYLLQDPHDVKSIGMVRPAVVQEYLTNPYLIDGYKFDLRIYVLLGNIEPLELYIGREGMARFCTVPYQSPSRMNLHESYMHLTNYSLNKYSDGFIHSEDGDIGSKRTLSSVLQRLKRRGKDVDKLWKDIEDIVLKTIIAILPEIKTFHHVMLPPGKTLGGPKCYQLLGFDILLTSDLKPILLEVNSNPSLKIDSEREVSPGVMESIPSPVDEEIKVPLVRDVLKVMKPQKKKPVSKSPSKSFSIPTILLIEFCVRLCDWHVTCQENVSTICFTGCLSAISIFGYILGRATLLHLIIFCFLLFPFFSRVLDNLTDEKKREVDDNSTDENRNLSEDSAGSSDSNANLLRELQLEEQQEKLVLLELYPRLQKQYEHFRLVERIAAMFCQFVGIRCTTRMGPTGFRTFTRTCKLHSNGLTTAAIDILYIDMARRWAHAIPDRTAGLCFQGFIDAFFYIAKRKYFARCEQFAEMVAALIDHCEGKLEERGTLFRAGVFASPL